MKLTPPPQITAEFHISTPLFLGGHDQKVDTELFRNSALKGALRFWWRALNWSRCLREAGAREDALKQMHQEEGELFGKAASAEQSRQSRVLISSTLKHGSPADFPADQVNYLLGQGLYDRKQGLLRDYLYNQTLTVTLTLCSTNETQQQQLANALMALGVLGGMGSRGRKGFGSLSLQSLTLPCGTTQSIENSDAIAVFLQQQDWSAASPAPLSALSQGGRVDVSATDESPLSLLRKANNALHAYRDGTINRGQQRQNNFPHDRDAIRQAGQQKNPANMPSRATFGLPHNYSNLKLGQNRPTAIEVVPAHPDLERRASPLLVHIHRFPDGQCALIHTLLPGQFLPGKQGIAFRNQKGKQLLARLENASPDYQAIHSYLDRFDHRKELHRG